MIWRVSVVATGIRGSIYRWVLFDENGTNQANLQNPTIYVSPEHQDSLVVEVPRHIIGVVAYLLDNDGTQRALALHRDGEVVQ